MLFRHALGNSSSSIVLWARPFICVFVVIFSCLLQFLSPYDLLYSVGILLSSCHFWPFVPRDHLLLEFTGFILGASGQEFFVLPLQIWKMDMAHLPFRVI